jgi:UDP-N-acetylmuramoylalanine--D-glutamate ligase
MIASACEQDSLLQRPPLELDGTARVLVVGMGATGLSVARFLDRRGIRFAVVDSRDAPPGLEELREAHPDAAVFTGAFDDRAFLAATHLVVSPGVPIDIAPIRAAAARGVRVLGDVDLFAAEVSAPVVGITGSNGKSTVTTLVGEMAQRDGRIARVGGNLGTPMLDLVDPKAELYVLELSSFQLERTHLLNCAAATVLNVTEDHMDRYADFQQYAEAKARVFNGQGTMVLNRDDPRVVAMALPERPVYWFGLGDDPALDFRIALVDGAEWLATREGPLLPTEALRIRGRHNWSNALAAVALGTVMGFSREAMIGALRSFAGLDHRMQWVAEIQGVTYINDSKATNVGACEAALSGIAGRAVLIAGGDGKGADFAPIAPLARTKLRAAVLIGRDAPLLEEVLRDVVPVARAQTMREAVMAAHRFAQAGDTVLLAPACASLDQYRDYRERGQVFIDAVRGLSP